VEVICTTCCAEKSLVPGLLPAVERYLHRRIGWCHEEAQHSGRPLLILSGEFGLIDAMQPIPWYDHALESHEVDALVPRVVQTLRERGVRRVRFVAHPASHPGWAPYHKLLQRACEALSIELLVEPPP